jgi:hypothetical protein
MITADRCQQLAAMLRIPGEKINLQCFDTTTNDSDVVEDTSSGANIGMIVGIVIGAIAGIAIGESALGWTRSDRVRHNISIALSHTQKHMHTILLPPSLFPLPPLPPSPPCRLQSPC